MSLGVFPESHHSEGTADNLLIQKKHEGGSQHCLEQLGLQAFKQTQHAVLSAKEKSGLEYMVAAVSNAK